MTSKKIYELNYTDASQTPIKVPRRVFITDILDITLIGKRTLEYGAVLNENVLHLLENFSCPSLEDSENEPDSNDVIGILLTNPVIGQLWYNSRNGRLYSWSGTAWKAYDLFSDVSGNSGFISDGDTVPIPLDLHGNTHNLSNCAINVSPSLIFDEIEDFTCEVSALGVVTCKYTPVGGSERSGVASYIIVCSGSTRAFIEEIEEG